jgi:hypothetical protein
MKNNNDQQYEIRKARMNKVHRVTTDVLVNPAVIEWNAAKLAVRTPKRRKINYAKKIMNDEFLFNV